MLHIRDDFLGTSGTTLNGRVPNITSNAAAWRDSSVATDAYIELNGSGAARAVVGDGSFIAYTFIDLDAATKARMEFVLRGTAGGAVQRYNSEIFFLTIELGSNLVNVSIEDDSVVLWSSNSGAGGGEAIGALGAGGVDVKFTIDWGDGELSLSIDDVVISTMSTGVGGDPNGTGELYFEVARGNTIEYIDIQEPADPVTAPFWTDLVGTREVL